MERTLSHFKINNLEIKLTSSKLYLVTPSSIEVFALRTIHGLAITDLIEEYNVKLNSQNSEQGCLKAVFYLFALVIIVVSVVGLSADTDNPLWIVLIIVAIALFLIPNMSKNNAPKPEMSSVLRIYMPTGNREFEFKKTGPEGQAVTELVAHIEASFNTTHNI